MASIEKAYSTDVKKLVDAEEAGLLFKQGEILSPRNFQCSGEKCSAQATCANMGKEIDERVRKPHFRVIGEHSESCLITKATKKRTPTGAPDKPERPQRASQPDKLIIRPNPVPERSDEADTRVRSSTPNAATRPRARRNRTTETQSQFTVIGNLVSKYIGYCQDGKDRRESIEFEGGFFKYSDFFRQVQDQEVKELPRQRRIYWGKAWVNRMESDSKYKIVFATQLKRGDLTPIKPSVFVSDSVLEAAPHKAHLKKALEDRKEVGSNRARKLCTLFVLSEPTLRGTYINFDLENLDHIEIRPVEFFDELETAIQNSRKADPLRAKKVSR